MDSVFSHLAWTQQSRKVGGVGTLQYPLLSDITKSISQNYSAACPPLTDTRCHALHAALQTSTVALLKS